jgi:toxin FitB
MSTDLIDSNLIIYAAQPKHRELREYVAAAAPAVPIVSKVETLGYHKLKADEQAFLTAFFEAAVVLPVSSCVVEAAIRDCGAYSQGG